jgi:Ca2+-binding EF-hand superfamily protein
MLDREQFRQMMGFLDTGNSATVLNRIFDSINYEGRPEGITFREFVIYLNQLLHGTHEEKVNLCFKMLDSKRKNFLTKMDFCSLILSAILTNNSRANRLELEFKAKAMAEVIFQKFCKVGDEKIQLKEFQEAVQQDPSLLEIFTLLSRGMTEGIVTNSEQEARLKWYIGQANYIVALLKDILREYDKSSVLPPGLVKSTIMSTKVDWPNQGGNPQNTMRTFDKYSSDFTANQAHTDMAKEMTKPLNAINHNIHERGRLLKDRRLTRNASGEIECIIKEEVEDRVDNFLIKQLEKGNGDNRATPQPNLAPVVSDSSRADPALNNSQRLNGFHTPSFPIRQEVLIMHKDFSFANTMGRRESNQHSGRAEPELEQLNGDTPVKDELILPEVPEEGLVYRPRNDEIRELIIRHRNLNFSRLGDKLDQISRYAESIENYSPSKTSNDRRRIKPVAIPNLDNSGDEIEPLKFTKKHSPANSTPQPNLRGSLTSAQPVISPDKMKGESEKSHHNDIASKKLAEFGMGYGTELSSQDDGGPATGRERQAIRNKLVDILHFSEEVVNKLNQERAQKQQQKEGEDQKKKMMRATVNIPNVAKGQDVIFVLHNGWDLAINIMVGINKATRALWDIEEHTLTKADYKMKDRFQLTYHRTLDDNNSKKNITFFNVAPYVFADIRRHFNISSEDFLSSIGSDVLISNLVKGELSAYRELFSTGRSGSFFYYSIDGKYVIKTIRYDEYKFLKNILMDYHQHVKKYPKTLITKFFGLQEMAFQPKGCVRTCRTTRLYLCIMDNIFGTDKSIQQRFDLKGSTYKRTVGQEKLKSNLQNKIALKDLDFISMGVKLKFQPQDVQEILMQIAHDCEFFVRNSIIDYSLLIGIHKVLESPSDSPPPSDIPKPANSIEDIPSHFICCFSTDRKEIYFFGIIDILTNFNSCKKRLEFFSKRLFLGPGISCVPPKQYAARFMEFMKNRIILS